MKKFTNLIVLDASGSMEAKISEVKGGIKQLFSSIKEEKMKYPDTEVTTILTDFSSARDFRVLVNTSNLDELTDAVADSYKTRGMTALYDAIGFSFKFIPEDQDGVFITIITDGLENDSKEYSYNNVKDLITDSRSKNWVISFMGTTEESIANAINMGISVGNTVQFDDSARGILYASEVMELSRTAYYGAVATGVSVDTENLVSNTLNVNDISSNLNK